MASFVPLESPSTFRRIAAAMWDRPRDPTIYGYVDIDVTATLGFIDRFRAATGLRLTMTGVVSAAVARAFAAHPELNARVRFGGRLERRTAVDLVVSVATGGGGDLSAARIDSADRLDLAGMTRALGAAVERTRAGDGRSYERSRALVRRLPWWAVRPALRLSDLAGNELGLDLPSLGMPRDPFGTAVITNVGMFGIDTAFAPFIPMSRCPLLLLITEVKERPWAAGGRVEARPVLRLCASFDHRIVDGYQAGLLARAITEAVTNPGRAATLEVAS